MNTILVVDDSTFQRGKITQILNSAGFEVEQRANGREALEYLSSNAPGIILLDLLMPDLDGFAVLETLKQRGNKVPIVILTADIQDTQRSHCLELGAVAFLNKPPKVESLLAEIHKHIKVPSNESYRAVLDRAQVDAITEIFNIGIGQAARVLNEMTSTHVQLQIPRLRVMDRDELLKHLEASKDTLYSSVQLGFKGDLSGSSALVFKLEDASTLVSLLVGDDSQPLDSVVETTLLEVGNIVINSVMGSISNTASKTLLYSVPEYRRDTVTNLFLESSTPVKRTCVLADTSFQIKTMSVQGEMMFLFEVESFEQILRAITL